MSLAFLFHQSDFFAVLICDYTIQVKGANHLPCSQRFFLDNQEKRQVKKNLWDQGTNITTQSTTPISAPVVVQRMEIQRGPADKWECYQKRTRRDRIR